MAHSLRFDIEGLHTFVRRALRSDAGLLVPRPRVTNAKPKAAKHDYGHV